ncbi:MAG TPA: site-2 protease family protein [Gemmataceae bacterium]|nr:site-2 protease family protein [Gemmataceae bacterium]
MFGTRWRIFRLLGIPISLDASWLIILALLTLSLAQMFPALMERFYPGVTPNVAPYNYWIMGLIAAVAFFICVLLHELGHAVVARSVGMPIRGITLFLFGGVAELGEEPISAGREFVMAIAGPAVSVVLAIGLGVLASVGYNTGWPPEVVIVLGYLAAVNGLVLLFNLIPAFPLDGGRVLRSIIWAVTGRLRRATYWASLLGQVFAWLLIAWGVVHLFSEQWLPGIWLGLIGLFLNHAARSAYQQVLVREALQGEPVRHFMNPQPIVVPPSLDLLHWVEDYVYRHHRKAFPVVDDGRLEGVITTQALTAIPRTQWPQRTVGEVMRHDLRAFTISPNADALQALSKMQRTGSSRLLITEDHHLLGIVSLKDLLRFLSLKLELEANGHDGRDPVHSPEEAEENVPQQ